MIRSVSFELIKSVFLSRGFIFALLLILSLHYGTIVIIRAIDYFKRSNWLKFFLLVLASAVVVGGFVYVMRTSFLYRILAYVIISVYMLVILSRSFVSWYSKTDEINKKLDKILGILEKKG